MEEYTEKIIEEQRMEVLFLTFTVTIQDTPMQR